jgi:hypothetical protein
MTLPDPILQRHGFEWDVNGHDVRVVKIGGKR